MDATAIGPEDRPVAEALYHANRPARDERRRLYEDKKAAAGIRIRDVEVWLRHQEMQAVLLTETEFEKARTPWKQ